MWLIVFGCFGSFFGFDGVVSSYLFEVGGFCVVFDMGNGVLSALQRMGYAYDVDAVLFSHLHVDHCFDVCGYYVARKYCLEGSAPRILVYGPVGVHERLDIAYCYLVFAGLAETFEFREWIEGTHTVGPLRVIVRHVWHLVEAYAMRFEFDGMVFVYSGDLFVDDGLVEIVCDSDLFFCEVSLFSEWNELDGIYFIGW